MDTPFCMPFVMLFDKSKMICKRVVKRAFFRDEYFFTVSKLHH
ncbi:MAG: hypothetical protein JWP81_2105 [Ferruginibacter sp.]|nr:hypothetical protein [Ferruginibacter sp.]